MTAVRLTRGADFWWDSPQLSDALRAGCTHFATEDRQSGRMLRPMATINPFDAVLASN
jgi:predicted nucleic acid-binding protein